MGEGRGAVLEQVDNFPAPVPGLPISGWARPESASGSEPVSSFLIFLLGRLSSRPGCRSSAKAKWELDAHPSDWGRPASALLCRGLTDVGALLCGGLTDVGADGLGESHHHGLGPSLGPQGMRGPLLMGRLGPLTDGWIVFLWAHLPALVSRAQSASLSVKWNWEIFCTAARC